MNFLWFIYNKRSSDLKRLCNKYWKLIIIRNTHIYLLIYMHMAFKFVNLKKLKINILLK